MPDKQTPVIVLGAGPAGLAAALSLAAANVEVTLVAPPEAVRADDWRTTALLGASVNLLENLDIWRVLQPLSAPLLGIRIVDDRGGLLRAPELLFDARELGLASFGANIANSPLVGALAEKVEGSPLIRRLSATATRIVCQPDAVDLDLSDGTHIRTLLVVAADGRNSLARKAAEITTRTWTYPQAALAASFRHAREHHGVSTELHRAQGPLTTVPLGANMSSLVWVTSPGQAEDLKRLDDASFRVQLEHELQGLLGEIVAQGPRAIFPLSGLAAQSMGSARVALVGEAGHVVPPIGAQGLNLGFRDAATLAEIVGEEVAAGADPGRPDVLAAYADRRRGDVLTRQVSVDMLNRSLLSDFLPLQAMRGIGMHLLANVRPLKELAMRSGMGPGSGLPRLMQDRTTQAAHPQS